MAVTSDGKSIGLKPKSPQDIFISSGDRFGSYYGLLGEPSKTLLSHNPRTPFLLEICVGENDGAGAVVPSGKASALPSLT